jgi:hypothetical protein
MFINFHCLALLYNSSMALEDPIASHYLPKQEQVATIRGNVLVILIPHALPIFANSFLNKIGFLWKLSQKY